MVAALVQASIDAAELMALAPSVVGRQFVEVELRVRGFFRSKGRIQSLHFKTQMSAYEGEHDDLRDAT
jgi:hypothetical protein